MSQVQPIAGNQSYSSVKDTVVTPSRVAAAQEAGGQAMIYEVSGSTPVPVSPASIADGDWTLLDSSGNYVHLPAGAVVSRIFVKQSSAFAATGTAAVALYRSDTINDVNGGDAVGASVLATATATGLLQAPEAAALTGSATQVYPTVTLASGPITAGSISYTIQYLG